MPHRNSTIKNQRESTVTLRRSPRLLTKQLPPPEYPKTPDPQPEKTHKRYPELNSGSNISVCLRRSPRFSGNKGTTTDEFDEKKSSGEANQKGLLNVGKDEVGINESTETVAGSEKRVTRRSGRGINESKQFESVEKITEEELPVVGSAKLGFHPCKGIGAKIEKRVTRHSSRGINESKEIGNVEKITEEGLPAVENAKVGINASKHFGDKLEKRTKRSSSVKKSKGNGVARSASTGIVNEGGFVDLGRAKVGGNSCKELGSKLEKRAICSYGASLELVGGERKKEGDLGRGVKEIGVKRKRNQFEEGHGVDKGWTKDQEMALQRAYFSAKPTPLIWKKVAKLVPGKSAKDCFNKLHSDHSTPPQPRTRLRSRKTNSPSFSLPTSTLLKPEEPITKKPICRKQSRHLAQKTVRQLLQKHYNVDQNYEADLFSVLESTMNPSTQALQKGLTHSTPGGEQKDSGYLKKCHDRSSSAHHAKHMSQFSGSYGATLASPPVLKPVKNKALHEKYIDQLHCREAKRRAAKVIRGKEKRKESCINIQKRDVIKAAKDALVFDAKDVINQFHQVKVSGMGNFSDSDDDFVESDDYEVESEH
ncbi:hypothetical protein RHGRI_021685 [Rhododendron griersonianum]|uniref:Uncharacterized protein n=1 Tax=Rhododendron griersonianum TaxID=479676 RepID=A0AAV6JL40_9ERIC|nr:hypothetical protein RHGRI_021685 [Rhododendron griersonianum]